MSNWEMQQKVARALRGKGIQRWRPRQARQTASVDVGAGVCAAVDLDTGVSVEVKTGQERTEREGSLRT